MIENMKDSGVEWIGEIPESWNILPLGNCFTERNEKVSDYDWEPLSVTKQGILKQLESAAKSDAHDARKKVCKNDFVINSRSDRKQSCGVSPYDGSVSLINIVLENRFLNPDYVKYLLNNYGFAEEFYRWGTGIVADLWSTKWERMKKIMLPIPPADVQKKIAKCLDDEIFKINERISITKQVIEDYKKYKQSLITEAVTKGLNPDVEMKDSGIEWIGEIPADWTTKKIKNIGEYRNGLTYNPADMVDENEGTLVLRSSNVQNGKIVYDDNVYVNMSIRPELKIQKGDILICSRNGSRELIGKNAVIEDEIEASFGAFMMIFRCNCPKYMYYVLNSAVFKYYLGSFFTATINQLTGNNFGNMRIVFCDNTKKQEEIVEFLDKKCTEIDNLISAKEQLIADMESYKKSLIYEYVTGKKEVSDNE